MAARSIATVYAFPVRPAPSRPGLWARLVNAVQQRRTRHMLADMDERMLADIGMNHRISRQAPKPDWPAWDVAGRGW